MSLDAINWVARQTTGDAKSKAALFWLAFHHNAETGLCCPSIRTLQTEMEVSAENTVRSALVRLRDQGFISWTREIKNGAVFRTLYALNFKAETRPSIHEGPSTVEVPQPLKEAQSLKEGPSTIEGGPLNDCRGVPQPLKPNKERNKEENKEENKEGVAAPPFDGDEPPFPECELWPDLPAPDSENPAPPEEPAPKRKRTPSGGATEATDGGPAPVKKSVRAKPKTLCPFDLEDVCPAEWTDAFAAAFPSLSLEAEFRRFVGHHVAKGTAFANWKAAFRNWLSNAVSFQARDTARFGYHPAPTRNRPLQKEDMVYTDNF